jgi:chemotaxis protein MotB
MAKKEIQPIIKKVIVEEHGGHHGGAWKVAYADFVTAMMAFFLLMWILASAEEEQKKGLADYFTPTLNPQPGMGGDGPLDGTTIGPPGTLNSSNSPMSAVAVPNFGQADPMSETRGEPQVVVEYAEGPSEAAKSVQDELQKAMEEKDHQAFADIEKQIVQAMNEVPDLKPLIPNVLFDETEEGLRIQIVDQNGQSMFPSGSAQVTDRTKKLLQLVGSMIAKLPNDVIISGHTDAVPFANEMAETGYGNWELSADRANATRRIFTTSGVELGRVSRVAGLADTDPLKPEDPVDPSNRRMSVVLEYMKAPSAEEIDEALSPDEKPAQEQAAPATKDKPVSTGGGMANHVDNADESGSDHAVDKQSDTPQNIRERGHGTITLDELKELKAD